MWLRAKTPGDIFEVGGRAVKWSPRTVRNVETEYGRWLSWILDGEPAAIEITPIDRVTRERVRQYFEHFPRTLSPYTIQMHLHQLGQMMAAVTQSAEFNWLFRAGNRLRPSSVRNKREKLQPSYALADLGFRLMNNAGGTPPSWHSPPAVIFRDGLIIALLAYRPLRLGNLVSIRIGTQLLSSGPNFSLAFSAAETKHGRALDFEIPRSLNAPFQIYLETYRPALLARGWHSGMTSDLLWVSRDGGPLTAAGLNLLIRKRTKEAFGTAINPHLFRDCAATTIATDDPSLVHAIPGILGHSSMVTSERHYNQARMIEAAESYQAVLKKERRRRQTA